MTLQPQCLAGSDNSQVETVMKQLPADIHSDIE